MKCWVCKRQARGFGHTDNRHGVGDPRRYPIDWVFCSQRCQTAFHAMYGNWLRAKDGRSDIKGVAMIDPSDIELAAMRKCLKSFGEAAGEIGRLVVLPGPGGGADDAPDGGNALVIEPRRAGDRGGRIGGSRFEAAARSAGRTVMQQVVPAHGGDGQQRRAGIEEPPRSREAGEPARGDDRLGLMMAVVVGRLAARREGRAVPLHRLGDRHGRGLHGRVAILRPAGRGERLGAGAQDIGGRAAAGRQVAFRRAQDLARRAPGKGERQHSLAGHGGWRHGLLRGRPASS